MDPIRKLKMACGVLFFIAGLNLLAGLAVLFLKIEVLLKMGLGFWNLIYGILFLILGFFAMKKSSLALAFGIAIFILDTILSLSFATEKMVTPPVGALIARVVFVMIMIQGFMAARTLKNSSGSGTDK